MAVHRTLMQDAFLTILDVDLIEMPPDAELAWLSEREQRRASLFRSPEHRRRYLAAHCALRRLIADATGIAADRQHFVIGRFGKPRLEEVAGFGFSLSYADDRALIGLSAAGAVGVDVERLRAIEDADELAALHFSPAECELLQAIAPGPERDRAFLQGWTRKEACVKAAGTGLSMPTAAFTSGLDDERSPLLLPASGGSVAVEVGALPAGRDRLAAWCRVLPSARQPESK